MRIDPVKRALALRKTLKKDDKVMVVDFSGTLQGKDTSKVIDLMPNVATGEYVFRAKVNIKEIDPMAAEVYGRNYRDVSKLPDAAIEAFVKKAEFDFPLWFKHNQGFSMRRVLDYNPPFIMQVAGCNFHDGSNTGGCRYCFVDNESNDGAVGSGKTYLAAGDAIDSFLAARGKVAAAYAAKGADLQMRVLRVSGGEPTIVLDWVLDLWREVGRRGLDCVGQIDSNLSTGMLVDKFEEWGIFEEHTLEKLAEFPVKVLTALKGVDAENLQDNVQSTATLRQQLYSVKRFLSAGFDIYPQMYNPNPATLERYLERMDSEIENFALRVHIGPLKVYGPTKARLQAEAKALGVDEAKHLADVQAQWDANFKNGCDVINDYLQKTYGVGYRDVVRSDVGLRLR